MKKPRVFSNAKSAPSSRGGFSPVSSAPPNNSKTGNSQIGVAQAGDSQIKAPLESGLARQTPEPTQCSSREDGDKQPIIKLLSSVADFFVFSYSPQLKSLMSWSENAPKILGVPDGKIARDGNLFMRYIHGDDRFQLLNDLESALAGKSAFRATYRWIRPDRNELRWLHCRASLNGAPPYQLFDGVILDITDELAGPLKYFAGTESLHSVLSALPGMVILLDRDLRITRLNCPEDTKHFSFGDLGFKQDHFKLGQPFLECFSDSQIVDNIQSIAQNIFAANSKTGTLRVQENEKHYKVDFVAQNETLSTESAGARVLPGLVCIVSDISDLVQLESQVAELHKTESLRLLSAGVGHHFNNALQTIIGQATVIGTRPDNIELVRKAADSIVASSLKAAELTHQLFSNIDKNATQPTAIDANLALTDAANKVDDLFSSGFKVSVVLGQVPMVKASYASLRKVFESLLMNAKDAMSAKRSSSHHLSIKSYAVEVKEREIVGLNSGMHTKIAITDSGTGMNTQTLDQCFDPFFTTKNPDQLSGVSLEGAGLGLSQAFSIVRSLGGIIKVVSQQPFGSCVEVYLPADEGHLESFIHETGLFHPQEETLNAPRVLLVDDDHIVSFAVKAMMHELKEECALAHNYALALSLMKRHSTSIELVLLDAVLPTTDSSLVLKRLKKIKPAVTIIGFSGAADEQTNPLLEAGALEIIKKPVELETLRDVLDRYLMGKVRLAQG